MATTASNVLGFGKLFIALTVVGVVLWVYFKIKKGVGAVAETAKKIGSHISDNIIKPIKPAASFMFGTSEESTLGTWLYDITHPTSSKGSSPQYVPAPSTPGSKPLPNLNRTPAPYSGTGASGQY